MFIPAFRYKQGDMTLLTAVIPLNILSQVYVIPRFGETDFGYQRKAVRRHYELIRNYVVEHSHTPVLPTAVVLGVNHDDLKLGGPVWSGGAVEIVHLDFSVPQRVFRVIDGQHRLLGLKDAVDKGAESLENYAFPVNIVVLEALDAYRTEIDAFVDINSKAKRIKTDLAILAKYQLELAGRERVEDFVEYVCTRIGYLMSEPGEEDDPATVWTQGIIVDPTPSPGELPGIVSISAWNRSLQRAVKHVLTTEYDKVPYSADDCAAVANLFADLLSKAWAAIEHRWPECFRKNVPRYDDDYVLQKAIGVNAMHIQLTDFILKYGFDKATRRFAQALANCEDVHADDWRVGSGKFSAFNSESGFKRVAGMIFSEYR